MNDRVWTVVGAENVIEVGVDGLNVAVPVGTTFGFQLFAVFQSEEMPPTHVASWATATPEAPLKTMTGITMRAARLSTVLSSNVDETNLRPARAPDVAAAHCVAGEHQQSEK